MFDITEMATELQADTAWQNTPLPVYIEDYIKFVVQAIKKFFVDRNRPEDYNRTLFTTNESGHVCYDSDFDIVQENYIYILAKILFVKKVYSDVSGDGAVSYTTNALSVTGAKEAYKSLQGQITDLETERIRVFHKMMTREEL